MTENGSDSLPFELPEQEAGKKYVITPAVVRGEEKLYMRDGSRAA